MQMGEYRRGKNVQIQLPNGKFMNVPADSAAASSATVPTSKGMNISEEMNRSGVWKNVNDGNVVTMPSFDNKPTCRNNRRREK